MPVRTFDNDDPFIDFTAGLVNPDTYLNDDFGTKLIRIAFIRRRSTFIPREVFLLLDHQYFLDSQFRLANHEMVISQINQLIYKININISLSINFYIIT
jgi:hypothetical protein